MVGCGRQHLLAGGHRVPTWKRDAAEIRSPAGRHCEPLAGVCWYLGIVTAQEHAISGEPDIDLDAVRAAFEGCRYGCDGVLRASVAHPAAVTEHQDAGGVGSDDIHLPCPSGRGHSSRPPPTLLAADHAR